MEHVKLEASAAEEQNLLYVQSDLRIEVVELTRLAAIKVSKTRILTAVEHVKLEASAAEEQNLLYVQSDLRIEVVELTRLAAIKVSKTRIL